MVPFKRLKYIIVLIAFAIPKADSYALVLNGTYLISSIPTKSYPIILKFQEDGMVSLRYFDGSDAFGKYKYNKRNITLFVGSDRLNFQSIELKGKEEFVSSDYPDVLLIPIKNLYTHGKPSMFSGSSYFIGGWRNTTVIKPIELYFEFLDKKFVFTKVDSLSRTTNVYAWDFRIIDGVPILICRFPHSQTFFLQEVSDFAFKASTYMRRQLEVTSFERANAHPDYDMLFKKWVCTECSVRMPIEINIGTKVGIKSVGEVELIFYDWYLSMYSNTILLTGPENAPPIYPAYYTFDFIDNGRKLLINHGGIKELYKSIN